MRAPTPQAIYILIPEFFCDEDLVDWPFRDGLRRHCMLHYFARRLNLLRHTLGLAAVGCMMLAWPTISVGEQSEALRRLRNNIHQDMTTCIAFFRLVGQCLAKNPRYAKSVAVYAKTTDDLLYKSILLGKQIGISDDDAKSRLAAAADEMTHFINNDCNNISSLLGRYLDKCTAVASDPLNPLKNTTPKR
jgi:hypothetical protein